MIELRLLGGIEVRDGNGQIDLASAKLAGLLAVLAVAGSKPVPRETLTEMLWGSHSDEQARQNFRQALSRLRKLLGAETIVSDDSAIRLDRRHVIVDIDCLSGNGVSAEQNIFNLQALSGLARGEFLEGLVIREPGFSEWLELERRRFNGQIREIDLRLAQTALDSTDAAAALTRADAMMRRDALDEDAHKLQLKALADLGRKHEALKVHQAFAQRLKSDLGADPDAETLALVDALRIATPSRSASFADARPSIAVMPFVNLSPDPDQGYFADGMTDELITALSRLPWLTVRSRSATFAFKSRPIDPRQAGRECDVRYVLEGTVRKAGGQIRISGQLIDAATSTTIWGGHFDGNLDRIFEFQDLVTAKVVGAVQPRLEQVELERSRQKPTTSLDAYDYYLRGLAELHRWTRDGNRAAISHFYRAIELDRRFAAAYGMAARCLCQRKTSDWVEDEARERAETEGLASLAVEFGRDDPVALAAAGFAVAFVLGKVSEGGELVERSLSINPGYAVAWMFKSWIKAWSGEADEALACVGRALDVSPHNPDPYVVNMRRLMGFAHFIAGRYEDSIACVQAFVTAPQSATTAFAAAAASAILLGRRDEAHAMMAELLQVAPSLRLATLRRRFPIVKDEDFNRFAGALGLAGLPE